MKSLTYSLTRLQHCKQRVSKTQQTINSNINAGGAKAIGSFTDINAVVIGLNIDDRHLVPDFINGQHLAVTQQLMNEVFVIILHWFQTSLTFVDVIPLHLRSWITCSSHTQHTLHQHQLNLTPNYICLSPTINENRIAPSPVSMKPTINFNNNNNNNTLTSKAP